MYGLGRYVTVWGDITLKGRVVYSDHVVDIPAYAISPEFIEQLGGLIRRVADKKPALVVPSSTECGFCPITLEDYLSAERCSDEPVQVCRRTWRTRCQSIPQNETGWQMTEGPGLSIVKQDCRSSCPGSIPLRWAEPFSR